jgi:hypothetical protein
MAADDARKGYDSLVEARRAYSPELSRDVGRPVTRVDGRRRVVAALVMVTCGAVLGLAAWLTPDERGYGTHEQLGFGTCGMLVTTGLPCPTCGMTTAFAYTVRGRFIRAFLAQPAGFVLALATAASALGAAWVLVTGRMPRVRMPIITPYRLFFGLLVLLLGSWVFKIVLGLATGALPDRG